MIPQEQQPHSPQPHKRTIVIGPQEHAVKVLLRDAHTQVLTTLLLPVAAMQFRPPSDLVPLFRVPTDVFLHCTSFMDVKSVCVLSTVCKSLRKLCSQAQIWDRISMVLYQRLQTAERAWDQLERRLDPIVLCTLRPGTSIQAIEQAEAAMQVRLPNAVRSSLLIHDGQIQNASRGAVFETRLLSLEEIIAERNKFFKGTPWIPLTARHGHIQICTESTGKIFLLEGALNIPHQKWRNFFEFLSAPTHVL